MRMPWNKNRKTDRALFTADTMKRAVEEVLNQNRAVRDVAKGLSRATVTRYVRHAHEARNLGSTTHYKKTQVTKQVVQNKMLFCSTFFTLVDRRNNL